MNCRTAQNAFSGYLDGTITGHQMHSVASHLAACSACATDFATLRGMQSVLGKVGPLKAPDDLGLRLRLAVSHEAARRNGHWWDVVSTRWDNMLRPALLQASAGFAGAVVLIGSIAMLIGLVAAPQAVLAHDEPLGAVTSPHHLYSIARVQPVFTTEDTTIVIEADVNAAGQVYDYKVLSGPDDASTEAQVRDQLMLQVYEPARVFGQPVRGHVLITFAGVSVRG